MPRPLHSLGSIALAVLEVLAVRSPIAFGAPLLLSFAPQLWLSGFARHCNHEIVTQTDSASRKSQMSCRLVDLVDPRAFCILPD